MTSKQKAEELFIKYFEVADSIEWTSEETALKAEKFNVDLGDDVLIYWHNLAKKSALIAVDEILNNKELLNHLDLEWWNEVKHEINKL